MSEYFSHDYNARNDLNMKKLFMGEGLAGIGLYWCIVEMLYEKGGYIELDYIPIIAFDLRTTEEVVHNVIERYGLFNSNDTHFYSTGVLNRLNLRAEKSEKARKSIEARWEKAKANNGENTNVIRTYNGSNTIKEKESKENKNESKEKEIVKKPSSRFTPPTLDEVKAYCSERNNNVDAQRFIDYYTANGWKVGRNAMKDWKAAVRTWERDKNIVSKQSAVYGSSKDEYMTHAYTEEQLNAHLISFE